MKSISALVLALAPALALPAQVIHSLDHHEIHLPAQFVVSAAGVEHVPDGAKDPAVIGWETIDLAALAKDAPAVEAARKKALLIGERAYFAATPSASSAHSPVAASPANPYRSFLELPINVTFNDSTQVTTQSLPARENGPRASTLPNGSRDAYLTDGARSASGVTTSTTRIADTTRYPLATNIEGLFLTIGDDHNPDAHALILELQKRPGFFLGLRRSLETLATGHPQDFEIPAAIKAVSRFAVGESTISVDDQRELVRFVEHCRTIIRSS